MEKKTTPPDAFIFMKVGDHAGESWEEILERKQREREQAGRIFWGYGGSTCHPLRQVQPFVRLHVGKTGRIQLLMEPVHSRAKPEVVPATQYSKDGVYWEPLPEGIEVIGSRYAFVLDEIRPGELDIPLEDFEVGIGMSRGRAADRYIGNRVDKGCFVRRESGIVVPSGSAEEGSAEGTQKRVAKFAAELVDPYAVLLR